MNTLYKVNSCWVFSLPHRCCYSKQFSKHNPLAFLDLELLLGYTENSYKRISRSLGEFCLPGVDGGCCRHGRRRELHLLRQPDNRQKISFVRIKKGNKRSEEGKVGHMDIPTEMRTIKVIYRGFFSIRCM